MSDRLRRLRREVGWYAASLAIVAVMLFPVYWMFQVSLKTPR
jgi:ABC-type glycerol-3-phosphate transport system permease component